MGLHGFPPMSPLSAATMLVSWADEHGRFPRATECRPAQGLCHWNVFYRTFHASTFSHVVSAALTLVSAVIMPVSSIAAQRQCLRCDAAFPDEGRHVRLCTACRKKVGAETTPSVTRSDLRTIGVTVRDWRDEVEM